jgi:hypothetical protein
MWIEAIHEREEWAGMVVVAGEELWRLHGSQPFKTQPTYTVLSINMIRNHMLLQLFAKLMHLSKLL